MTKYWQTTMECADGSTPNKLNIVEEVEPTWKVGDSYTTTEKGVTTEWRITAVEEKTL